MFNFYEKQFSKGLTVMSIPVALHPHINIQWYQFFSFKLLAILLVSHYVMRVHWCSVSFLVMGTEQKAHNSTLSYPLSSHYGYDLHTYD